MHYYFHLQKFGCKLLWLYHYKLYFNLSQIFVARFTVALPCLRHAPGVYCTVLYVAEHESRLICTTSTCTHLIHGRKTMIGRIFYGHAQFMYSTRASIISALHSRSFFESKILHIIRIIPHHYHKVNLKK